MEDRKVKLPQALARYIDNDSAPLRIREVQPTRKVKWGRVVKWTLMGVGVSAILVVIVLI